MAGMPIWYELMTPDPGAVAPFYNAVLGWDIPAVGSVMSNGADYRAIGRADGGHAGGVLKFSPEMAGMKPNWIPYFHVDDVDGAISRAQGMGATVHMPATTIEGAGRMAMLTDAQGAAFYLMAPTAPPDQPDAQSDVFDVVKPGHCRWNELNTSDAEAAKAFYPALLGWTLGGVMPMGELGDYQFVEVDGVGIGAINPVLPPGVPPHWLAVFGVADIDAAKAAAEGNGGTISHDIHEVPGGEYVFYGADPAGAAVAFVGPKGA